jgi:serine/threonine-protein kinase RsbW
MSLGALAVRHDATSAALVRHSIADDLADHAITEDSIADVILVASELVGNAVLHTPTGARDDLDIRWDVQPDCVVVQVADPSDRLPEPRTTDERQTSGRGLAIVAAIAADWGVTRSAAGKQVWARVPVTAD